MKHAQGLTFQYFDRWQHGQLVLMLLPRPFSLLYLMGKMETWGQELDLEVRQHLKVLFGGQHNIELFVSAPAKRRLLFSGTLAFLHHLECY